MSSLHIAKMLKFQWLQPHFAPVLVTAPSAFLRAFFSSFISRPQAKCTSIFDDIPQSAFATNLPVILSISYNIQNKHNVTILTKTGVGPFYAHFMQLLRRSRARRFRLLWRTLKFALIWGHFQKSTFDINLPVILSIPLGVDDKKSKRNFHQTSVSVAPNAFSHQKKLPSPSKTGSPRTEDLHFLKKK